MRVMEEPVLTMETTRLHAEPGGQAQLSVKLRNAGRLVESYRMDVVGLDPSWWQVHPPELSIYPGAEEPAVVVLTPLVNAQASDEALPFAVRAVSTLDAARAVVEEGDLEIGRIENLQAAITPVTSRGRWSGRHVLTYTNGGNSPVELGPSASDQDEDSASGSNPGRFPYPSVAPRQRGCGSARATRSCAARRYTGLSRWWASRWGSWRRPVHRIWRLPASRAPTRAVRCSPAQSNSCRSCPAVRSRSVPSWSRRSPGWSWYW